jgi:hypothetical protein
MINESVVINCQSCGGWFTVAESGWDNYTNETQHCTSCLEGELVHAHEQNLQTPYQAAQARLIKLEMESLEKRLVNLARILIEDYWEGV